MEFSIIDPNDERILSLVDDPTRSIISDKTRRAVGVAGVLDNKLCVIGIFSFQGTDVSNIELNFLYTIPSMRSKGLVGELLKYSREEFGAQKIKSISAQMGARNVECEEILNYMNHWGFYPLDFSQKILNYLYPEMNLEKTTLAIKANKSRFCTGCAITDRRDKKISAFIAEGNDFERNAYDTEFSRFVIEDGKITDAIIVRQLLKRTIFISNIYFEKDEDIQKKFLSLLCDLLDNVSERLGDDFEIIISITSEQIYNGMCQIFGKPLAEFNVLNFIMLTNITEKEVG